MIIYAIKPFYIIVLAVIIVCLLNILYTLVIKPLYYKKKALTLISKASKESNTPYQIDKTRKDGSTFTLIINNKTYNVKVLQTPKKCDLQINNIETFVVYTKTLSDTMKSKVLSDMKTFMNSKMENRIIIIPSKAKTIKKVINECEMIMVNHTVDVYKTKIYNEKEIINLFK